MNQPTLFDRAPKASLEALQSVKPTRQAKLAAVFAVLRAAGDRGCTDDELYRALPHLKTDCVRPRRWELVKSGHAIDSGEQRQLSSGRKATVWRWTGKPLGERSPGAADF